MSDFTCYSSSAIIIVVYFYSSVSEVICNVHVVALRGFHNQGLLWLELLMSRQPLGSASYQLTFLITWTLIQDTKVLFKKKRESHRRIWIEKQVFKTWQELKRPGFMVAIQLL